MTWFSNRLQIEYSILFHFLLHCYATCIYSGCPEFSAVEPCSCIYRPGTNILLCAGLKEPTVLNRVLERSSDWAFHTLFVCQSNLQNIPSSSLVAKSIKSVLVANSNMTSLFDKEPDSENLVEILHINNVQFQDGIPWSVFDTLGKLQYFNFQFGDVPVLGSEITEHFSGDLRKFSLSNTGTKQVEKGAFANLMELTEIKIRHCDILSLERSVFPKPAKLTLLDFTSNQIESLPDDIFSDMPNLKLVYFAENKIARLSSVVLEYAIDHLEFLNLVGNPLNCDCDFKMMVEKDKKNLDGNCVHPEDKIGVCLSSLTSNDFSTCS